MAHNNYIMHNADTLRQLLNEDKDLPIIFAINEEFAFRISDSGWHTTDFPFEYCDNFHCEKKFVIFENPYYELVYHFDNEDDLRNFIIRYHSVHRNYNTSDEETFNKFIEDEVNKLKPYWVEAIIVYLE